MSDERQQLLEDIQHQLLRPLIEASQAETKAGEAIAAAELAYSERQLARLHQIKVIVTCTIGVGFLALVGTMVYLFVAGKESFAMQLLQTIIAIPTGYSVGRLHQKKLDAPKNG